MLLFRLVVNFRSDYLFAKSISCWQTTTEFGEIRGSWCKARELLTPGVNFQFMDGFVTRGYKTVNLHHTVDSILVCILYK